MAHKKGLGSSRNGRDSNPKMLGVKMFAGQDVKACVSGRPEMPVEAVREAAVAVDVPKRARVLEVGAGTGQLTHALLELGFDVVALEPGDALRACAATRAAGARLVDSTFEDF